MTDSFERAAELMAEINGEIEVVPAAADAVSVSDGPGFSPLAKLAEELARQNKSDVVDRAVRTHCVYMYAAQDKIDAVKALDGGNDKGPEHDDYYQRVSELREAGHRV